MASSNPCIEKLFLNARTHSAWIDKPVTDETLRELYDALRWGPTSANASPARFVFIRSAKAKERLRPSLAPGNLDKTMAAPVTVIVAYDLQFHEKLPKLFPHNPTMRDLLRVHWGSTAGRCRGSTTRSWTKSFSVPAKTAKDASRSFSLPVT